MKLKLSMLRFQSFRYGLLFAVLCLPFLSSAQTPYSVSPRVIEHSLEPRESIEEQIKITNAGPSKIRIFPTVNAITLGADGKIEEFISPVMTDQSTNIASWLEISRARLELAPGESVKIPLTININPTAKPGEYYAFVGFATGDKRDDSEREVERGTAQGVTIRVDIADMKTEYLRLHRFVVDRYVTNPTESMVEYELENTGDVPLQPRGEIIFYDVRGKEVGAVSVADATLSLAPGERKTFTTPLPPTGSYGRHKAFLSLEYGAKQRASLYDTTFFTLIPLQLLIVIFVSLLSSTLILTWLYYRRNKRHNVYTSTDEAVAVYVRPGLQSNHHDHDVNLRQE
jgi:hypothetical protein